MLGCGAWEAYLYERGGQVLAAVLPWASLSCGRVVDEISEASVTVPGACADLDVVDEYTHELLLGRNGQPAWAGPILVPEFTRESVQLPARDLFQWFDRRVLETSRNFHNDDLSVIFSQYAADALAPDPSPNITVTTSLTGVTASRTLRGAELRYAGDELRELARNGLDFSTILREVRVRGEADDTGPVFTLTDAMIDDPKVIPRGDTSTTQMIVRGRSEAITGRASVPSGRTGLLQTVVTEDAIDDNDSADSAAAARLTASANRPMELTGTLTPVADVEFEQLLPGILVDVRLQVNVRRHIQVMRLVEVKVDATQNEDGTPTEKVAVTLVSTNG